MQVFKNFFRIIKANLGASIMYLCVFLFIAIFISGTIKETNTKKFEKHSIDIAFINNDIDSPLIKGLYDILAKDNNIKTLINEKEKLQESLFYREVEYIVIIPEGFTKLFENGDEIKIGKMQIANSNSSTYIDMTINKYFNTLKLYNKYGDKNTNYLENIKNNTDIQANVEMLNSNNKSVEKGQIDYYFGYSSYVLTAVILLSICTFIMKYNKKEIKDRTTCSPISKRKINMQIFFAMITYSMIVFVILEVMAVILYPTEFFTIKGALQSLNMLVYTLMCVTLSFLIGNIVKSDVALTAVVNLISLSFCFLGGVFVPQAILGKTVSFVGSFTPAYWFTKACDRIVTMPDYSIQNLNQVFGYMLIVVCFALAMFTVGLVVTKQSKSNG